MAKKRRKVESGIDQAVLQQMQENNRLAAEAQAREAELLRQQTEAQRQQYELMTGVYQQQQQAAEKARLEQEALATELQRKQEEQARLVQGEQNRAEAVTQEQRGRQLRQYNRRNSVLLQRANNPGGRVSLFTRELTRPNGGVMGG